MQVKVCASDHALNCLGRCSPTKFWVVVFHTQSWANRNLCTEYVIWVCWDVIDIFSRDSTYFVWPWNMTVESTTQYKTVNFPQFVNRTDCQTETVLYEKSASKMTLTSQILLFFATFHYLHDFCASINCFDCHFDKKHQLPCSSKISCKGDACVLCELLILKSRICPSFQEMWFLDMSEAGAQEF